MNNFTALAEKLTPKIIIILVLLLAVILGLVFWGAAKRLKNVPELMWPGGGQVVVPYGVVVPEDAKKPAEAVREALRVPGYENESPTQVEALPGANGKVEYWSVKTDKGYVTVKAKP